VHAVIAQFRGWLPSRLASAIILPWLLWLGGGGPDGARAYAGGARAASLAGPGITTQAILGMGNGSGPGVPAAVLRALTSERVQELLRQQAARSPAVTEAAPPARPNSRDETVEAVEESTKEPYGQHPKVDLRGKFKERIGYPLAERGGYKMSFYWLAWESAYSSEPYDVDIYTRQGFRIGRFPRTYVFELKMEGSGILRDGRIINYDGVCRYGVGTCFTELDPREHPLGKGGQQRPLLPFKSVAVDPRFVPLGTPLYLPELRGLQLPDGTTHDGCVRADDTGGNIRRRELDFFVESYENYKLIEDRLWNDHHVTPFIEEPRCDYLRTFNLVVDRKTEATDWAALHKQQAAPDRKPSAKAIAVRVLKVRGKSRHRGRTSHGKPSARSR
jgi:3D (Asp-Asp-Asp) domain-containing protein